MTSRPYAQIECSLTGSKKFRGLSGPTAKLVYICIHLSDFCTYAGLFHYPLAMWAHDAQLERNELLEAIQELIQARLIEFDQTEEFVRVVGWFHKRNGPKNPNCFVGVVKDLARLRDVPSGMYCASAAELAVAALQRVMSWKEDAKGRTDLNGSIKRFLNSCYADYDEEFLNSLEAELEKSARGSVAKEMSSLFPPLLVRLDEGFGKGSQTLSRHETRQDEHQDKTNTKKLKADCGETKP